jgi:hypothetical protein
MLVAAETWCGQFDIFFEMMAHPGAGGNGGKGGPFSKSHHQQQKPPLFTRDLNLEIVNRILCVVEPWVHNRDEAQCTTQLNRVNISAS